MYAVSGVIDGDDELAVFVGDNCDSCVISFELEPHFELLVLKERIKCVGVDVVADEPFLFEDSFVVVNCDGLNDGCTERFGIGKFVTEAVSIAHIQYNMNGGKPAMQCNSQI